MNVWGDFVPNQNIAMKTICSLAAQNPGELVRQSEENYAGIISSLCINAIGNEHGRKILLLAGPSASGKTTTAHMIAERLKSMGRNSAVVSMDDFYLDRADSPRFPDGRPDYESVKALDLPLLGSVLREFLETGSCIMPTFDFTVGKRSQVTKSLSLGRDDVVILEGLHALNPEIVTHLPQDMLFKVYVRVGTSVTNDEGKIALGKKDLRLLRRLVRDYKFRDFNVYETFEIWITVVYGEKKYLSPFKDTADIQIDTFHPYEPCALAADGISLLGSVDPESRYYKKAREMLEVLRTFPEISTDMIPGNSLLREFSGK